MRLSTGLSGTLAAIAAFTMWGLLAAYWKLLITVPSEQILCHRIIWSAVVTAIVLTLQRRWNEVRAICSSRRTMALFAGSGCMVAFNWWLYIWAVNHDHVLESSLGYYINPLVFQLFGFAIFRDRLRRVQWLAIAFAAAGVGVSVLHYGRMPWIALLLAITFALYGVLRKVATAEPMPGLFFETAFTTPFAVAFLLWQDALGAGALFRMGVGLDALMIGAGVVTTAPLLLFAFATRRISLMTIGITQYIGPTGMFLLGVFAYDEPFTRTSMITFGLIWTGVLLYLAESVAHYRATHPPKTSA